MKPKKATAVTSSIANRKQAKLEAADVGRRLTKSCLKDVQTFEQSSRSESPPSKFYTGQR